MSVLCQRTPMRKKESHGKHQAHALVDADELHRRHQGSEIHACFAQMNQFREKSGKAHKKHPNSSVLSTHNMYCTQTGGNLKIATTNQL